jgi:uncharacterized protein YneF (UPF0154 family)
MESTQMPSSDSVVTAPPTPAPKSNFGLGIVLGVIAAVAAAAIWAAVAVVTEYEIGWLAIATGALVGIACLKGAKEASSQLGAVAVTLAICSLLIAKLIIFAWVVPTEMRKEVMNNPEYLTQAVHMHMLAHGEYPAELAKKIEAVPEDSPDWPAVAQQVVTATNARMQSMSAAEKDQAVGVFADLVMSNISISERVKDSLSPWDILWTILAVMAAWRIASGSAAAQS